MHKNITIAVIAVIAIIVSVVFIVRSNPSTPTAEASPLRELPPPNEKTSLPQEVVATDPGLADRIRERISSQEGVTELSPSQIELLVDQSAAILQVRAGGAFDDYFDLMESWGGTCVLGEKDLEELRNGWKPPDHPVSIAQYDVNTLTAEVRDSPETISPPGGPGVFSFTTASQFRFQSYWIELLGGQTKEVRLIIPSKNNAGDVVEQRISLLWSEADNQWIPFHLSMLIRQGRPLPATIF